MLYIFSSLCYHFKKERIMIVSYIDADINSLEYQKNRELFSDICNIFFVEYDDGIKFVTERNYVVLCDIVTHYTPSLFVVNSLQEFPFSSTQIAEFILLVLKFGCVFQSRRDNLSFSKEDSLDVYPTVFSISKES